MTYEITEEVREYLKKKQFTAIIVELCTAENTEVEVSELHVYGANQKRADFMKKNRGYRSMSTDYGELLLPPYRLTCEEKVVFSLKKFGPFSFIRYTGMKV